ncbi:S41 family peptidase [Candidatus Peregrinibacteria bacterium]|nr:S41 family peptidase [Candidatus Peregrinibacteria bacterium]
MIERGLGKSREKNKYIYGYIVAAVFSFLLGWQANYLDVFDENKAVDDEPVLSDQTENVDLELFWTVWKEIEDKYVHEEAIDSQKMVYGAIAGMVNSLEDPYTVFMTPDESKEFNASLDGKLEGIGAELTVEHKNLVIVSPLRQSPAEKAGLLAGDIIYKIDDNLASEMTLIDAIMKIRGPKGTPVTLTVVRENLDIPFEVTIVRDSITIESVTMEKLDGDIVYLSVNQFNDTTNQEFGKAISELVLNEPKGLIVDLRYNGGGYLDIAVELLSYLLPADTKAVALRERGKEDEIMYTNGNTKLLNVPLVVIVNESSASASEILAGAVQDHKRGIILGAMSFGKGTVQEVESFTDGSSIRLTIAKWLTPEGRDIDKIGLTPDIVVEINEKDIQEKKDPQKEAAVKYLKNLQ